MTVANDTTPASGTRFVTQFVTAQSQKNAATGSEAMESRSACAVGVIGLLLRPPAFMFPFDELTFVDADFNSASTSASDTESGTPRLSDPVCETSVVVCVQAGDASAIHHLL